jgi:hypothetical protein
MRRLLLALGMTGLVLSLPGTAEAGGNWIGVDRLYYRAGETVTAKLGYYGTGRAELESHGPYYLWITDDRDAWHQPPPLGRGAIQLGEVRFLGRKGWRAEVTFVVPDLDPGKYILQVCNDPCTRTIDVDATAFNIALNPLRAQLIARIDALHRDLEQVSKQARKAKGLAAEQRRELSTLHTLAAQVELLTGRVEDLEKPTVRPEEPQGIPAWIPIAGLVAAALAGYAGGRLAGRVQRRGPWAGPPPQEMLPDDEDLTLTRS